MEGCKEVEMNRTHILIRLLTCCMMFFFPSCDSLYKAGNLVVLDYPIETNLKSDIVMKYLDTLIYHSGHNAPEKWNHLNKLVDLDSNINKRIYFESPPEAMYVISDPAGLLRLSDVYNEKIRRNGWVAERD